MAAMVVEEESSAISGVEKVLLIFLRAAAWKRKYFT